MKFSRWGWGLKRLSLARFQQNRARGFGESAKKWVAWGVVFLSRVRRTTSATFLRLISAKLSTNTCPGGVSRHMVSHSRKVSIKGSNLPKNPLLGYPICDQPTGHGKHSATPTLFPSPRSHRCALPGWLLLRYVPFSSYQRPNVFLCHGISNGETWMPIFFSNILARRRHDRIADLHLYTTSVHIF